MGEDWKRLTKSGVDLAGTGGEFLDVTYKQLSKHNRRKDCWIALNGTVYNVTPYMDYHPGKGPFTNLLAHTTALDRLHPSVEKDLCLKIEVRDQTIWKSTPEL